LSVSGQGRVFVNPERTVLVTIWPGAANGEKVVEVATRDDPGAVWSPPVRVEEERT
jgi:hypothetical protein